MDREFTLHHEGAVLPGPRIWLSRLPTQKDDDMCYDLSIQASSK